MQTYLKEAGSVKVGDRIKENTALGFAVYRKVEAIDYYGDEVAFTFGDPRAPCLIVRQNYKLPIVDS